MGGMGSGCGGVAVSSKRLRFVVGWVGTAGPGARHVKMEGDGGGLMVIGRVARSIWVVQGLGCCGWKAGSVGTAIVIGGVLLKEWCSCCWKAGGEDGGSAGGLSAAAVCLIEVHDLSAWGWKFDRVGAFLGGSSGSGSGYLSTRFWSEPRGGSDKIVTGFGNAVGVLQIVGDAGIGRVSNISSMRASSRLASSAENVALVEAFLVGFCGRESNDLFCTKGS